MAQIVHTDKAHTPQYTKKHTLHQAGRGGGKTSRRQERIAATVVRQAIEKKKEVDAYLGQFEDARMWEAVAKEYAPRYVHQR